MGVTSAGRNFSGKTLDPVFICMVSAMVLAIGSGLALRVMVAHAGPAAAQASEFEDGPSKAPMQTPVIHPTTKPD